MHSSAEGPAAGAPETHGEFTRAETASVIGCICTIERLLRGITSLGRVRQQSVSGVSVSLSLSVYLSIPPSLSL